MKSLLFIPAATLIFATAALAQTNEPALKNDIASLNKEESSIKKEKKQERNELRAAKAAEVSYLAKEQFYSDFGNIPVTKWERTPHFDKATFTKDGQVISAYYDTDARLIGTTIPKTFADLPANAQKFINSKYKDYSKEDVIFFDDNELNETDMVFHDTPFNDADNYFVELRKENKEIVLQVTMDGYVIFFKEIK